MDWHYRCSHVLKAGFSTGITYHKDSLGQVPLQQKGCTPFSYAAPIRFSRACVEEPHDELCSMSLMSTVDKHGGYFIGIYQSIH